MMKLKVGKYLFLSVILFASSIAHGRWDGGDNSRWGSVAYDLEVAEFSITKCAHSKIKKLTIKHFVQRIDIRIECEPVPGEVNRKNPDLYK